MDEQPDLQQEEQVQEAPQEAQAPSIEDVAKEQGWRPKEEYEGDPSKWVSAETFVAKGELIEKIEALGKELKSQKKANQMLLEHHQKIKVSEFQRAVEFLKTEKKRAYEEGDVDRIMEIDDQIANVKETQKMQQNQAVIEEPDPHPEFLTWTKENRWYEKDSELREEADILGTTYAKRNPNKTPLEVLEWTSKQIKKIYPDKFTNPNRNKPSAVEGGSTSSSKRIEDYPLTEEERRAMMTFVRTGIMTKDEYIKDLKAIKGEK